MVKKHLNLLVEDELIQKAKSHGLVLSKFLENKLQEYFLFMDAVNKVQKNQKEKSGLVEI